MKRLIAGTVAVLMAAVLVFPRPARAVSAQSALLMDAATGRVLYEKNADARALIASTTKIMTALVVCQQCNVMDRVRIPQEAVGIEGSSLYLQAGEILTVQELLYGLMLHSGNDAAVALAIYCGGTVEGFVALMNDKARALGLDGTHFENPNGLDSPGHYSTARDLATLAAYALEDPIFAQTVGTKTVTIGTRHLRNHNKLLWTVPGADGVKTGYTRAAGRTLVSSVTRQGRRLVCVTLGAPRDWEDHKTLVEAGFSRYTPKQLLTQGQILGEMALVGGETDRVPLAAGADFTYSLAPGEEPRILLAGGGFAFAPVVQGQQAGFAYICLGDKAVGKVPVYYTKTVERPAGPEPSFWEKLLGGGEG